MNTVIGISSQVPLPSDLKKKGEREGGGGLNLNLES